MSTTAEHLNEGNTILMRVFILSKNTLSTSPLPLLRGCYSYLTLSSTSLLLELFRTFINATNATIADIVIVYFK